MFSCVAVAKIVAKMPMFPYAYHLCFMEDFVYCVFLCSRQALYGAGGSGPGLERGEIMQLLCPSDIHGTRNVFTKKQLDRGCPCLVQSFFLSI